ncbi:MAG: hypothetical protein ACFFDF_05325, partial [Candidatus Odinarchaeota archaeon]
PGSSISIPSPLFPEMMFLSPSVIPPTTFDGADHIPTPCPEFPRASVRQICRISSINQDFAKSSPLFLFY